MIDPEGVEGTAPADDAVNNVPFSEQQLGKIASILSGDPGNEGRFGHKGGFNDRRQTSVRRSYYKLQ